MKEITGGRENEQGYYLCESKGRSGKVNVGCKYRHRAYTKYKKKIDVFYVAFSGGKDSVVTLDLVQRALPHNEFKVLFGDTGMEFPDTYKTVDKIHDYCSDNTAKITCNEWNVSKETTGRKW